MDTSSYKLFLDSWEWSDKWNLFFRNWAAGPPSQSSGSGDCVGMLTTNSGKWAQYSCDLQQPFICYHVEKRKQIVRLKLSCNGECTLNDPSLQTAILKEINEKLKSMGLENDSKISWTKGEGEEVFHQINHTMSCMETPERRATEEAMPLVKWALKAIGLFWSSSALSRQYHYINARMSWPEAQSYCREKYTDLATVDTMADVNRLVNIVDAGYSGSVWIGLKRGTQKRWAWSNGENISSPYSN
ncbi:lymphocyte antigen 75-like [Pseudorasbora parva]|uniref:lymphocyte antigen 75-like n=1 Tax=Pseudorasbora parva TaxID=51549 RepID=UPI00351E183D